MTRPLAVGVLAAALALAPLPALAAPPGTGQLGTGVVSVPTTVHLDIGQEQQAERIGMKIHCPICSGESIAQSQTDISRQMMNQVREMIQAGRSEQDILNSFAARYGERILLEPPRRGLTSLLWTLPIALLVLGALLWWTYLKRASAPVRVLSEEEEKRIRDLMRDAE